MATQTQMSERTVLEQIEDLRQEAFDAEQEAREKHAEAQQKWEERGEKLAAMKELLEQADSEDMGTLLSAGPDQHRPNAQEASRRARLPSTARRAAVRSAVRSAVRPPWRPRPPRRAGRAARPCQPLQPRRVARKAPTVSTGKT